MTPIKNINPNILEKAPFCLGLAFYDILCLISFILNGGLRFWGFWLSPVPKQYLDYYPVYIPVTWPIEQIAHTGNTLCTVLLCVERLA